VLGVALRALTIISVRPTTILEDGYQNFALSGPFKDPTHPAGYALLLGALGHVTHNINAPVMLQHLSGICSALLIGAATRRVTGSQWAGLLPAGIILLGGDGIFLEHSIMSESWALLAISIGLYAAVRSLDEPERWSRWPLLAGGALGIAVTLRSASLFLVAVVVLAMLVGVKPWPLRWRASVAAVAVVAVILLAYSFANAAFGPRFGISPSPGWYLYGRVAQFADCRRFTPPPGTAALCQNTPVSQRPTAYGYMFIRQQSPALRVFGAFGRDDGLVGAWAQRALRAQFGDFLSTGWVYLRGYYVPSSLPARLSSSTQLDPQLSFTNGGNIFYVAAAIQALQAFFGPFNLHSVHWGVQLLRGVQLVIRFGATALFATTILTLVGLVIGTRRSRVGVLLFGIGGLSLLIAPAFTSTYAGRYTVPMAGPIMAAAAITITELARAIRRSRVGSRPYPPTTGATGLQTGVTG
jgi:hypothetical protein